MGIEAIGLIGGLMGTVVSAMGQMQAAKAQAAQQEYQAQVARNNSIIAQNEAQRVRQEGALAAQNTNLKTAAMAGSARAAAAANGLDVNEGSPLDLQESVYKVGMLDALTEKYNSETKAVGYVNQANNFTGQAGAYEAGAANAKSGGNLAAFGSILSGATSFASKWSSGGGFGGGGSPLGMNA